MRINISTKKTTSTINGPEQHQRSALNLYLFCLIPDPEYFEEITGSPKLPVDRVELSSARAHGTSGEKYDVKFAGRGSP